MRQLCRCTTLLSVSPACGHDPTNHLCLLALQPVDGALPLLSTLLELKTHK